MKGIITVLGMDKVGIIAKVCAVLADSGVNILDISQTILNGYFNMIMIVDFTSANASFDDVATKLSILGDSIGVVINTQHEGIFNCMHRI